MEGISQAAPHCLMKGGKEICKNQNVNQSKEHAGGPFSACWAGGWASTREQSHWASKLGFVLGLQWGQSNWALYTNQRSDQRTSHCSVSMTLVNLWRWYFYFSPVLFWLRSGKADSLGHYCLQMMSFVSVRFSFYWVTLQNGIIWSLTFHRLAVQHLCSHLGISKQKKLFGSYFIGRLFAIPCLPSINFHSKLLRVHITLSPLRNSEMFRIWLSKHQGLPSCPLSLWNCVFHLPFMFFLQADAVGCVMRCLRWWPWLHSADSLQFFSHTSMPVNLSQ